jgi:Zn-dependent protease
LGLFLRKIFKNTLFNQKLISDTLSCMDISFIFQIAILIFSVVIHEVSHGYAALIQGDVTAKYAGRLTLNPIKHLDPIGSVFVPIILSLIPGGLIFGWAKPVPYNPYNLRNKRWGEVFVAAAGPASNVFIALIFGLLIRFSETLHLPNSFVELSLTVVLINIVLTIFNLVPIPPLDGSKILFGFFPQKTIKIKDFFNRYSLIILLFFIFFLWKYLDPVILFVVEIFTGIKLS